MKLVIAMMFVWGSLFAQCPYGNALRFDGTCGSGNYVQIQGTPELSSFDQITVECWFKQLAPVPCFEEYIFHKGDHVFAAGTIALLVSNSCCDWNGAHLEFRFHQSDTEGYSVDWPHDLEFGVWHHIAGVWDESTLYLFINGELVLQNSAAIGGPVGGAPGNAYMNHHYWGDSSERLTAVVDEFRISNIARYLAPFTPISTPFVVDEYTNLLYHFDEESGNVAHDSSPFSNHGALINNPQWICSDAPLPVELLSFAATPSNNRVTLNWSTGSESNVSHFEIERDGRSMAHVAATNNASGHAYTWLDDEVSNGQTYSYTLASVDLDGSRVVHGTVEATPRTEVLPNEFSLAQNYPNPFNASTTIEYSLPEATDISLKLFNLAGQEVLILASGAQAAGSHVVHLNANELSSGIYFYRLESAERSIQQKMVLLK